MKKIVLMLAAFLIMPSIKAKEKDDPVVMTVAGKDIKASEFIFIAKKDNSVDLNDSKSVKNYIELFKNYKLKVADAEALGINQSPKFAKEMEDYKTQLQESFLSDKASQDSVIRVIYDRMKYIPSIKHIMFGFPRNKEHIVGQDTVEAYNKAVALYQRIKNGEDYDTLGEKLSKEDTTKTVFYGSDEYFFPMSGALKSIEEKIFSMKAGEISEPIRSLSGFHILKVDKIRENPGQVRVAHILTRFANPQPTEEDDAETLKKSEEIYQQAINGADFAELAKQFSADSSNAANGGLIPFFGLGTMVESFENAAFALQNQGDISKPVKTQFGYHIIKLIDKRASIPFEELESRIYESMRKIPERKNDLFHGFDEKMKIRHKIIVDQEAYKELMDLANDYYPTDEDYFQRGMKMEKNLVIFEDSINFPQHEFVHYMYNRPQSEKNLSCDYIDDMFHIFIRDIASELERRTLESDYPEFNQLINEYHDGILLFELSNKRVWQYPAEEQAGKEAEWIKEINEKYPVTINWKVLNKIKKYL